MTTDTNALLSAARCFKCIPPGSLREVMIYVLIQWAQKKSSPVAFAYTPATVPISWHETVAGNLTATSLADFYSKYTAANVDSFLLSASGITSISNLNLLPNLSFLLCDNNPGITTMDYTGCLKLTAATPHDCGLTSISGLSGLPMLTSVDVRNNPSLSALDCSISPVVQLRITGATAIVNLNASGCAITNSIVSFFINTVLSNLNTNGLTNGYCNMSGGTSAAPSASGPNGITAKASLITKGWTVLTN